MRAESRLIEAARSERAETWADCRHCGNAYFIAHAGNPEPALYCTFHCFYAARFWRGQNACGDCGMALTPDDGRRLPNGAIARAGKPLMVCMDCQAAHAAGRTRACEACNGHRATLTLSPETALFVCASCNGGDA